MSKPINVNSKVCLNLGCGKQVVNGWVNVDYSLGARLHRIPIIGIILKKLRLFSHNWDPRIVIANLNQDLPWESNSIDVVYSSHTLEHLNKTNGHSLLREVYRVLKPGGICRFVVPNLDTIIEEYQAGLIKADDFIEQLDVIHRDHRNPLKKMLITYFSFPHQCMYTPERLEEIFNEIGFTASQKQGFESQINDILEIELVDRIANNAVIIEGIK